MKPIYLDVCVLCRPFDEQQQGRIASETRAIMSILNEVKQQRFSLIVSPMHHVEINAIRDYEKQKQLLLTLKELGTNYSSDLSVVRDRVKWFLQTGMKLADATHLAYAELARASLVTVDDHFLKQCYRINFDLWCGGPLKFCQQENIAI